MEAVAEERVELGIIEGPAMRRDVKTERLVEDEMGADCESEPCVGGEGRGERFGRRS